MKTTRLKYKGFEINLTAPRYELEAWLKKFPELSSNIVLPEPKKQDNEIPPKKK